MLIVEARKPSNDPVQEKLRQDKAIWNKAVSTFISDVINLKRLMNGHPSPFHMEKSSIKEPIPSDPNTILGVLLSDFQEISQKGNGIIQNQIDYSKNRKRPQPKNPVDNLSQQLTADLNYQLVAEGSNPLSRFYSRFIQGPYFLKSHDARQRKYRLSFLEAIDKLEKDFEKLQNQIVGSGVESIFISKNILIKIEEQIDFIKASIEAFIKLQLKSLPAKDQETISNDSLEPSELSLNPGMSSDVGSAEAYIADFRKNYFNLDKSITNNQTTSLKSFSDLMVRFLASDPAVKARLAIQVMYAYNALLTDVKNTLNSQNIDYNKSASSFEDLLNSSSHIEITAQNIVDRWVGKLKHKINPFDKTSGARLDISNQAAEARKVLDSLMDILQKNLDLEAITTSLKEIEGIISTIDTIMKPLDVNMKGKMLDKTFLQMLKNKNLTDQNVKLQPKEQQQLERMLKNKQFSELIKLYFNNEKS